MMMQVMHMNITENEEKNLELPTRFPEKETIRLSPWFPVIGRSISCESNIIYLTSNLKVILMLGLHSH
jgi:hypothetical protein